MFLLYTVGNRIKTNSETSSKVYTVAALKIVQLYSNSADYFREHHRSSSEPNCKRESCKAKYRMILNFVRLQWPINRNPENNLESPCIIGEPGTSTCLIKKLTTGREIQPIT
jgi:hypothetical protein